MIHALLSHSTQMNSNIKIVVYTGDVGKTKGAILDGVEVTFAFVGHQSDRTRSFSSVILK